MMRPIAARACLCVAFLVGLVSCDDQPDVAAAGAPSVELRGTIASAQTASAAAAVDGRVTEISVREGSAVKAGQVVATLANAAIDRDLAFARAQVAVTQQRLREARKPIARQLMLGDAGARERASAEILKNREARRDRYRDLYKTHDISKQELEDAENDYAAALREWLTERERASIKVVEQDTSVMELELEKARADEAFAADRKSLLVVKAPIDGVVTRVGARVGESVYTRDAIADIANTSTVEVRAQIAPELMRYARVGLPVDVKIFTVPPRRFRAPVRNVVPGAGGATLIVELPNPDGVLQAGQNAVVTVR